MSDLNTETPFTSLAALRADHRHLQKLFRDRPSTEFDHIESFIKRGRATGAILDDEHAQAAAQSLLDFWATTLYRSGRPVPESTLVPFDPELAPLLDDGVVPYVGLDAFAEQKKSLFFGRSRAVETLVNRLHNENLVAVIGPSGSGKSSLVLAGLIPALKAGAVPGSQKWRYLGRMVPGSDALGTLVRLLGRQTGSVINVSSELSRIEGDPSAFLALIERLFPSEPTVLVIDQFEELSTLCENAGSRATFEKALAHLVTNGTVRHVVILTMRSDFIGAVAREPAFQQILENALEPVTPLTASELREAIERPAQEIGLKFEDGVVEALVHDILGEPAALPLLQFTLLKLWENREHNRVTREAYRALGGGRLALTRVADSFIGGLIPEDRVMADRIFLRLVRPGIGQDNVSNRVRRRTLYTLGPEQHVSRVLDKLIGERLIRVTGDTDSDSEVEVAHEALVRNWHYLVKLLDGEREQQKTRIRLEAKATEWVRLGRGEAGLLKSVALSEAEDWVADPESSSQSSENLRALVIASRNAADHAERRQRESKRRLILLAASAFIFAGFAFWGMMAALKSSGEARQAAARERQAAERAKQASDELLGYTTLQKQAAEEGRSEAERRAEFERAQKLRSESLANQLTVKDRQLRERQRQLEEEKDSALKKGRQFDAGELTISAGAAIADDPEAATLLALQGALLLHLNNQQLPANTIATLYQAIHANRLRGTIADATGDTPLAFSPDSRMFVTGGNNYPVRIWDTATHKLLKTIQVAGATAAAFSWDNQQLAIASDAVRIFAPSTGQVVDTFDDPAIGIKRLVFSPNGQSLAAVGNGPEAHLWALRDGPSLRHRTLSDPSRSGGDDRPAGPQFLRTASFSPTGAFIATAGSDQLIRVWRTATGELVTTLRGHLRPINEVAFLNDGRRLVTADDGGVVKMWRALPLPITAADLKSTSVFSRLTPLTGKETGESASVQLTPGPIRSLGLMPDGLRVMVVTGPPETAGFTTAFAGPTVTALDVAGTNLTLSGIFTLPARDATEFLLSPNATLLATTGPFVPGEIWSTDRGSGTVLGTRLESVTALSASTDGTFRTMSSSGVVRSWDLSKPGREMIDALVVPGRASVFSLDGRHTAFVCTSQTACSGVAVYSLTTKQLERTFPLGAVESLPPLALNSNGSVLAWANPLRLNLANVVTGRQSDPIPLADVTSVALSRDDKRIAASTADGTVHLLAWNGEQMTPLVKTKLAARPTNVTFSPDGTALAVVAADRTISVWKPAVGELGASSKTVTLSGHTSNIKAVAFSKDGRFLLSGGDDRTARVWDLGAGTVSPQLTINVGPRSVSGVAFTEDEKGILASADDGTLRWFPGIDSDPLPWALTRLTRTFSGDECRVDFCKMLADAIDDVVQGNHLAELGDERDAVAKYESARRSLPGLPLEPAADARRLVSETQAFALRQETRGQQLQLDTFARANQMTEARAVLERLPAPMRVGIDLERTSTASGRDLANTLRGLAQLSLRSRNRQEARRLVALAKEADPTSGKDIDAELADLNLVSEQQRATVLLESGNIAEAVSVVTSLRRAGVRDTPFDNSDRLANELCWHGSLRTAELAREPVVREACETAVKLSDGAISNYRDSRGLNRARNGDYEGAIDDFMTFANDSDNLERDRANRRKWIEALKRKGNPFTPDVLESLR